MQLLVQTLPDGACQCHACGHECRIPDGARGICGMRLNRGGQLETALARVTGLAMDPMEKKPLFHYFPGTDILSFGGLGCSFSCAFCQNWGISQVGRDESARGTDTACTAEQLVATALHYRAKAIAATYNEPFIRAEWVAEVLSLGKSYGLGGVMVTNGFASEASLERVMPAVDAVNVDLKCFTRGGYRELGGRLEVVLNAIRRFFEAGKWVELTTLIVPGFNDSAQEFAGIASFIASLSLEIPWHISAWHEDYNWHPGVVRTPSVLLAQAVEAGRRAGLHYIYTGNIGGVSAQESTVCPHCGRMLIRREGFCILENALREGCCPQCGAHIPGVWGR